MTNKTIYYCVYRITNLVEGKHYYGYKSSSQHPKEILGRTYFSSKRGVIGKRFVFDQKNNPQSYKYKIVQLFDSKEEALAREIRLHKKFNVQKNRKFYNAKNQTDNGFDTTGMCCVIDEHGNQFMIETSDEDYRAGKYTTKSKMCAVNGVTTYKDLLTGEHVRLHKDVAKNAPERFKHIAVGQVTVRDSNGNTFNVKKTDPRYISGELKCAITGQVTVYDEKTESTFNIYKDDPRYISGELQHINRVFVTVKDSDGNRLRVKKTDPRYISGEVVGFKSGSKISIPSKNIGFVVCKDKQGNKKRVRQDDERLQSGELTGVMKGLLRVKNISGDQILVYTDDPRYISGEYIHWKRSFE